MDCIFMFINMWWHKYNYYVKDSTNTKDIKCKENSESTHITIKTKTYIIILEWMNV